MVVYVATNPRHPAAEERNIFRVDVACDKDKDYEGTARAAPCDSLVRGLRG